MPTPTPTAWITSWPTPTPWQFAAATPQINVPQSAVVSDVANNAVAGWQWANQNGAIDAMMTLLIAFIVLWGLRRIVRELRKS